MDGDAFEGDGTGDPNEQTEGRYTDVDGKPVTRRSLRGRYTRTDQAGPDREDKSAYTDAEHADRSTPPPHSVHDRPGKYTRRDQ